MVSRRPRDDSVAQPDETSPLLRDVEAGGDGGTGPDDGEDYVNGNVKSRGLDHAVKANQEDEDGDRDSSDETPALPASDTPFLNGVSVKRFWVIFIVINVTFFISIFDTTIIASSHPIITSHFNSANSASWLSTAYLLTSTVTQPLVGRITDSSGRKVPFVIAVSIITGGTLWCALAQSLISIILARAFCGFGAGAMFALAGILVSDLVPIERRGAYQSLFNLVFGAGSALGAGLGGVMADAWGWRWEFGVQVPFLVILTAVAMIALPADLGLYGRKPESIWSAVKAFDIKGSILLTIAITFLVLGLNLGGNVLPWSHPFIITSVIIAGLSFPIFLFAESKALRPVMPPKLISKSPHGNLILANFLGCVIQYAIFFNIPLFFQGVLLSSATDSGLRLAMPAGFACLVGAATGFLITYTKRLKWPLVLGTTLYLLGTVVLAVMRPGWPEWLYLLSLLPVSAGQGFLFPGTFIAVLAASEQQAQAVTTSTLLLWRSIGLVMGIASSSLVVQNALVWYLEAYVKGPEKESVIRQVRKSVEAIRSLSPEYQAQVISSYEAALRLTFLCLCALGAISVLLILPVKLPRLGTRE